MQTLRKKTSPLKYKNETSRFLGEGVSFKAKLIGILEVSEARGDRMCQEALSDLKMAIRAAGEHKQRITINIAIDGLRLRDEKTGDSLYHHPVHKISFIAQDMTDSRAFGYIFGSPDTGHRFFGIKTDKAASQVVIAMRDLFQVVFALKKKEIELAKQHLDKTRYGTSIFSDTAMSSTKALAQDSTKTLSDTKGGASSSDSKSGCPAVADLVDLELELSSLQQGINQMERITPSDPFGSKDDPFGDSFTNYPSKTILPPPPAGRERASRASESSSIFSPKSSHTGGSVDASSAADNALFNTASELNFSHDLNSSLDEQSNGDWFTPSASDKIFEEPPLIPEPTKDQQLEQHERTKQEILSQFDVFTELDPLGTGKNKPYIDKKDFFQELKNPPKKVLNDLASEKPLQENKLFNANFEPTPGGKASTFNNAVFNSDPFGEDPFDKTDPFAESELQDPFNTEGFGVDFKMFNKNITSNDFSEKFKFPVTESMSPLFTSTLSKSPNRSLEKQVSLVGTSPRSVQFGKQNTFDVKFDKFEAKPMNGLQHSHDNRSLDMSSESEAAPEPPPRPAISLIQIKPPPLPPKKQPGDISLKPPPRPPYSEESHYDYMDHYETAPSSLEYVRSADKSPPIPAPARKARFESEFQTVPDRPKKNFGLQSSDEDYLTPISFPQPKEFKSVPRNSGPILLPPPQKSTKRHNPAKQSASSGTVIENNTQDNSNKSLEGLDITLSQLTLSGLNELANKLNIPPGQLSNMTLVQLTDFLSRFIKSQPSSTDNDSSTNQLSSFNADFANFNNFNDSREPHDKYAVFRELLQEEIRQTKIDTEPEEHQQEKARLEDEKLNNFDAKPNNENVDKVDRYAALREIVESEIRLTIKEESVEENNITESETEDFVRDKQNNLNEDADKDTTKIKNETNIIRTEKRLYEDNNKDIIAPKDNVIEYIAPGDIKMELKSPIKSPVKSPVNKVKSPVPMAVTDVIQTNNRLTSGSLSDAVSGSSPEVDNTASTSEVAKKTADATAESWAIFDAPSLSQPPVSEKNTVQSEEVVSPWSSDSKEFGGVSPPDWRHRADSGSGGDRWNRRTNRREQHEGGWWDTSAEPEPQFCPANCRSTDSFDDECYEYYDRPPRRRRQMTWRTYGSQAAGGHSSSSRDVSPWEEEPRRRDTRENRDPREQRGGGENWAQHVKQHSCERRPHRHADSWDEEDDYEYDEEHSGRYHWPDRHGSRETERERHSAGVRENERWTEEWSDERRHRRRRELVDRDRWCCPDWEQDGLEPPTRYGSGRRSNPDAPTNVRRERKAEDRYYPRDAQESPWEDDYSNEPEDSVTSRYVTAKRNWKRPSSASEMDRKTGEIKSRSGQYHSTTGGSDGERDRRYKGTRRSRSRDSQFTETTHNRHKLDPCLTLRGPQRSKQHLHQKQHFESDFPQDMPSKQLDSSKLELSNKKLSTVVPRKKTKDSPKEEITVNTFPRKSTSRSQHMFENDFVPSETDSPLSAGGNTRFNFENDFETSEADSPIIVPKSLKSMRKQSMFESNQRRAKLNLRPTSGDSRMGGNFKEISDKTSPRLRTSQKSPFEDDFSPQIEKLETPIHENISTSSIKEETDGNEEDDSFTTNNFDRVQLRKKIFNKARLSGNLTDVNLKKSESVNIFERESDPFDDEFFSEKNVDDDDSIHVCHEKLSPRNQERKWTEDFEEYDTEARK